jgi:hypothetical protein
MTGLVDVRFATAVRSGPLTLAQRDWLRSVPPGTAGSFTDNLCAVIGTVPGTTCASAVAAVRDVLERHEGLRSRIEFRRDGTPVVQHVEPADLRLADVVRMTTDAAADGPSFETAKRTAFALDQQWPVLFVFFLEEALAGRSAVRRVGVVVDHFAADGLALQLLCDDLAAALAARAGGREPFDDQRPEQPIDAALRESGAQALREREEALEHWRRQLARLEPASAGPPPPTTADGAGTSRAAASYPACRMSSPRAAQAAAAVAQALGISASAVFLYAFGLAVCELTGAAAAGVFPQSANRREPESRRSVRMTTVIAPPVVVAVGDAGSRAEALRDCALQLRAAYRIPAADPADTDRLCGPHLGFPEGVDKPYLRFNYLNEAVLGPDADRHAPDRDRAAQAGGGPETPVPVPPTPQGTAHMLHILHFRSRAELLFKWNADIGWARRAPRLLPLLVDVLAATAAELADPGGESDV